jgi:hypothetical protein
MHADKLVLFLTSSFYLPLLRAVIGVSGSELLCTMKLSMLSVSGVKLNLSALGQDVSR